MEDQAEESEVAMKNLFSMSDDPYDDDDDYGFSFPSYGNLDEKKIRLANSKIYQKILNELLKHLK